MEQEQGAATLEQWTADSEQEAVAAAAAKEKATEEEAAEEEAAAVETAAATAEEAAAASAGDAGARGVASEADKVAAAALREWDRQNGWLDSREERAASSWWRWQQ